MEYFLKGKEIVETLVSKGFLAYFAGGWVRDFLMNNPSEDIDIATNAPLEELEKLFPKAIHVGAQFGVLVVPFKGSFFEIATFRIDGNYENGRHPTFISQATPEEDAMRRDFTINGMFYDPLKEEVIDFVEGQKDLKKGIIRAIGNPLERFQEDKLRMIRAVRFSCRYQFLIEENTQKAILEEASSLFPSVSIERVVQEFIKMGEKKNIGKGMNLLKDLHLLQEIFPEWVTRSFSFSKELLRLLDDQPFYGILISLIEAFKIEDKEPLLKLSLRLKLSKKEVKRGNLYIDLKKNFQTEDPVFWVSFLKEEESIECVDAFSFLLNKEQKKDFLNKIEKIQMDYKQAIERHKNGKKLFQGEDFFALGISKGPLIGLLIEEAEKIAIRQNIDDKENVLQQIKQTEYWQNK